MHKVYVVGLGPGSREGLPLGTYQKLRLGLPVYLRTRIHPVVDDLLQEQITFTSFDDLYETGEQFAEIYQAMTRTLLQAAVEHGEIVYAVPGHPLMAEQSVQNLLKQAALNEPRVTIEVGSGQSFFDSVCTVLEVDPVEGLVLLDGTTLVSDQLRAGLHTLIAQVYNRQIASEVKLTLMEVFPDDYPIAVVRAAGVPAEERIERVPLYELDRLGCIDHLTTVYVPKAVDPSFQSRDPWSVVELVRRLRSPGGCPWDLKQTHETLRPYVLEEAYEVAAAIDSQEPLELCDELGDLLLQVFLHAQIASESGEFTVRDVFQTLGDKLIRRHPHVFGDVLATSVDEAERAWQTAKASEQQPSESVSLLSGLRRGRPAWQTAREMQARAAAVGFDWNQIGPVLDKLREETTEVEQALAQRDAQQVENEVGDLLFTVVNVLRWLDLDLEGVLELANTKFEQRFQAVELRVQASQADWSQLSMDRLQQFWEEAKRGEG